MATLGHGTNLQGALCSCAYEKRRKLATTNTTPKARGARPIIGLFAIILVLFGSLFAGTKWSDASWTPNLALDLEGGTQIILQAVTANNEPVSSEDINQAIEIIRQRVDSSGVAETEITSQGGKNIVVAIPGKPSQETLDLVRESAQMQFRPVLFFGNPQAMPTGQPSDQPEAPVTPGEELTGGDDAAADQGGADNAEQSTAPDEPTVEESPAAQEPDAQETPAPEAPAAEPTNNSDLAWITPEIMDEFNALDCTAPENLKGGGGVADPAKPLVTCEVDGSAKYILGPMDFAGSEIKRASSGLEQTQSGATLSTWEVRLEFTKQGTKDFGEVTTRLSKLPEYGEWISTPNPTQAPNMFAMALDNLVIGAPGVTYPITTGEASITGNYTNESANILANQLNFGALPLTFEVQSEETISATLGSEQLQKGLLAGLIGLGLVVVYSLIQYRVLGLVTVISLVVAGVLTYAAITVLSWVQGYRLSLPGVAGVILAVGITADSFIVYFERIRDELRDGRNLEGAVAVGWDRAKRTIIASDTVNFIAAVVLYFLAVGGVRGFAFTLGLTTLIDLVIVFFFTHPVMTLLAKTKFFAGGHKLSGFDPDGLGIAPTRYVGRGRVAAAGQPAAKNSNGKRLTIAERKAAQEAEEAAKSEELSSVNVDIENPIDAKDGDR